jgi:hypothetical protein
VLLAIASTLLYFALGMLFLVPGDPGGTYWETARVVYGVAPLLFGLLALAVSTWVATVYNNHGDLVDAIKRNMLYATVGIVLVFAALSVNDLYVHFPIHIR